MASAILGWRLRGTVGTSWSLCPQQENRERKRAGPFVAQLQGAQLNVYLLSLRRIKGAPDSGAPGREPRPLLEEVVGTVGA